MNNTQLLLLRGGDIRRLLQNQEAAVLEAVAQAYQTHALGDTMMPPDSYLRFPEKEKERIISKAAYLGGPFQTAGLKWIASFPGNISRGMERASATLILNSINTGRPLAVMESSIISAKRTAASAALAAQHLWHYGDLSAVGLLGCGLINYEVLRFICAVYPMVETVHLFDLSTERAEQFLARVQKLHADLHVVIQDDASALWKEAPVVSLATTAVVPHIDSLDGHQKDAVFLHVSLRDFTPELILQADNVVDDIAKVTSNKTSVHLAQQQTGDNDFIRAAIGEILNDTASPRDPDTPFTIFSPFGLGILDLAVADVVYHRAQDQKVGTEIEDFLPPSWLES